MEQVGSGNLGMDPDRGRQQEGDPSNGVAKQNAGMADLPSEATGRPKRKPSAAQGKRKKALRHSSSSPPGDRASKRPAFEQPLPDRLVSQPPVAHSRAPAKEPSQPLGARDEQSRGTAGRQFGAAAAAGDDSEDSFALHFSTDDEQEEEVSGHEARGRIRPSAQDPAKARSRQGKPSRVKQSGSRERPGGFHTSDMQECHVRPPRGSVTQQSIPTVSLSPRATWPLKGYSSSPQVGFLCKSCTF